MGTHVDGHLRFNAGAPNANLFSKGTATGTLSSRGLADSRARAEVPTFTAVFVACGTSNPMQGIAQLVRRGTCGHYTKRSVNAISAPSFSASVADAGPGERRLSELIVGT